MNNDNSDLQQFFEDSWQHMHKLLDVHMPVAKRRRSRLLIGLWIGLGMFLLAAASWLIDAFIHPIPSAPALPSEKIEIYDETDYTQMPSNAYDVRHNTPTHRTMDISPDHTSPDRPAKRAIAAPPTPKRREPHHSLKKKPPVQQILMSFQPNILKSAAHSPSTSAVDTPTAKATTFVHPLQKPASDIAPIDIAYTPQLLTMSIAKANRPPMTQDITQRPQSYLDIYAGTTLSIWAYFSASAGAHLGVSLTSQWEIETGLGYKYLFAREVTYKPTTKSIRFQGKKIYTDLFSHDHQLSSTPIPAITYALHLHLIELPLRLRYRRTSRWSIHAEIIGATAFATRLYPHASHSWDLSSKFLTGSIQKVPFLWGAGGGCSYRLHRVRLSMGYRYWPNLDSDHQLNLYLSYRL